MWERDGWNGISYTGREPGMIRMCFLHRLQKRVGKRANMVWAHRVVLKSIMRHYSGRKALEYRRMLGGRA